MDMLCLIRFAPVSPDRLIAWEALELFRAALPGADGQLLHAIEWQLMTVFGHPEQALRLLSDTMEIGRYEGFAISASLAQGIQSRATMATHLSGFTEGSIETLFDLAGAATLQEVVISGRLSSIIKLAAPGYWSRFRAIRPPAHASVRSLYAMSTLPLDAHGLSAALPNGAPDAIRHQPAQVCD